MAYDDVIAFENLYKSLKECCNGVRWKDSVVGYEANALKNTYKLWLSLNDGSYKIDKCKSITVYEPRKRTVLVPSIKDKQFQKSLCENGFYTEITKSFISDNCACQKQRGVDYALNRLTAHLRRYYNQYGTEGWVLKCDIHHYFASIRHDVAKAAVRKRVKDAETARRVCDVIDSFGGEVGIGLGSQISQLVALAVLDDLDHLIKDRWRIKRYVRYMDDSIFIHPDKDYLRSRRDDIARELGALALTLNAKTVLYPLSQGVKFLQWRFVLTKSGRIVRYMQKDKLSNERGKLKKLLAGEAAGIYGKGSARASLTSWIANAEKGSTFYYQQKMLDYYAKTEAKIYEHLQTACAGGSNG